MKHVTIRFDIKLPEDMHEFLLSEAYTKKLSFEGLFVSYIGERMRGALEQRRRSRHDPRL
jgi:hypothetical protein